uniref:hypothetical protein n=1 Tax=uncultured Sphingomonas sp. TaxID=158754 RepID=UPI0035C9E027
MTFRDPRFVIAMSIICLFSGAYIANPTAEMSGAIIAAFSGAWGFYLGSSSGAAKNADNVGKALDLNASTLPPTPPVAVLQPGQTAQAAPDPNL